MLFYTLNWLFVTQLLGYMVAVLRLLHRHTVTMKNLFSNIEKVKLIWLRNITYMAGFVSLTFLLENVLVLNNSLDTDYIISSVLTGVYVYSMGYMGLSKSEVFSKEIEKSVNFGTGNKIGKKYKRSACREKKRMFI